MSGIKTLLFCLFVCSFFTMSIFSYFVREWEDNNNNISNKNTEVGKIWHSIPFSENHFFHERHIKLLAVSCNLHYY